MPQTTDLLARALSARDIGLLGFEGGKGSLMTSEVTASVASVSYTHLTLPTNREV